jgi:hypothetical protein
VKPFSEQHVNRLNRIVTSLSVRAGNHDPRTNLVKEDALGLIQDQAREIVRLEHELSNAYAERAH